MKSKISAIIALVLVFIMLFSMASCNDTSDVEGNGESEEITTNSDNNKGDIPEEDRYENPNKNYNKEQITIASTSYDGAWNVLQYNVAMIEDTVGTPISKAIVKRNGIVEKELNILIDLFPLDNQDRADTSKLQNAINRGEKLYDFALQMCGGLSTMLQTKGMLVNLQSIETLNLSKSWWNQNANEEYTIYGAQYAAVGDICFFNLGAPIVMYFSKDLVKNKQLEDPYVLAENGTWTMDKMIAMATQVSEDLDGDDKIEDTDQFGLAAESSSYIYFFMMTGNRFTGRDTDGNITITVNTEHAIKSIEKTRDTLTNDSITRAMNIQVMMSSGKYTSFHADYAIPKMKNAELLFMSFQLLGAINMGQAGVEFGIIPSPKYDIAQEEYYSFGNASFSDYLIVPGGSITPDLEMIGYVIDSMGYYAQQQITPAFIDVSVTSRSVRDEISAVWVGRILDSQIFDVGTIFNWGSITNLSRSENFSSDYKTLESGINTALENTITNIKG